MLLLHRQKNEESQIAPPQNAIVLSRNQREWRDEAKSAYRKWWGRRGTPTIER
jgi:hypothetical protein